jgi:hypothetical protein
MQEGKQKAAEEDECADGKRSRATADEEGEAGEEKPQGTACGGRPTHMSGSRAGKKPNRLRLIARHFVQGCFFSNCQTELFTTNF